MDIGGSFDYLLPETAPDVLKRECSPNFPVSACGPAFLKESLFPDEKTVVILVVEDAPGEMVMLWQGLPRPHAASPLFLQGAFHPHGSR
jgi:hypothetical protein